MRFAFRKSAEKDSEPIAVSAHFDLGRRGEALALDHLQQIGYRIVAANFSLPI